MALEGMHVAPMSWKTLRWVRTLRGQLVLGLALTLLVIVTLVLAMAWYFGESMLQQGNLANLRYDSNMLADEVSQQMRSRMDALERVADTLAGEDDTVRVRDLLAHNDPLLEWFEGLVVADADGVIIADWPALDDRIGLKSGNSEFFRMLQGTHQSYVSEPFIGPVSHYPLVLISVPRF